MTGISVSGMTSVNQFLDFSLHFYDNFGFEVEKSITATLATKALRYTI
jgi:hypothetical protein